MSRAVTWVRAWPLRRAGVHLVLMLYTALCLGPVLLVLVNSFKSRAAIFGAPLSLPGPGSFSLLGYATVIGSGGFQSYFLNSLIVTVGSLAGVLLFATLDAALNMLGVPAYPKLILRGAIVILAVAAYAARTREHVA